MYDKKAQIIREAKVVFKIILTQGNLLSLSDAYKDEDYMAYAAERGLVKNGKLLDFYDKTSIADELDHVVSKGKGGKFVKENCIPVVSQHNPRRGYTDEPAIKLKRICEDKVSACVDHNEVVARYFEWQGSTESTITDFETYEDLFLTLQLELAKATDKIVKDFCDATGRHDPTPCEAEKYAKKIRDRASR